MEREKGLRDPADAAGFIRSLKALWLHFESEGYEPRMLVDYRPWVVVFHSEANGQSESWLVCTSSACPSNVYELAAADLPDTLTMRSCGVVNGNDYMVFTR